MNKTCPICNSLFSIKEHEAHRRVCCSRECANKRHSQSMTGTGNSNYGEQIIVLSCVYCGKDFYRKKRLCRKANVTKNVFCSKSCSIKYQAKVTDWGQRFRGKQRDDMVGENNHNWRGGITAISRGIRHSSEYQRWRKEIIRRDKQCVICGCDINLHADHILPFIHYPELIFNVNNGRTLCQECHKKTDTYGKRVRRKVQGMEPSYIL